MNKKPRSAQFYLSALAVVFASVVVVLGAFTRLVDAGLGCPDWPTCYGHFLWPNTEAEVEAANLAFQGTPVEHDKTWPEQVHRLFASTLGLLVLGLFYLAVKNIEASRPWKLTALLLVLLVGGTVARAIVGPSLDKPVGMMVLVYMAVMLMCQWRYIRDPAFQQPFALTAFIAGLVILQGLFGMWTVTLKLWPQVVTAHLLGGFTTLCLLFLLTLRHYAPSFSVPAQSSVLKPIRPFAVLGLVLVALQVMLGGWLSANYAAFACPDLPTCQGSWWPSMNWSEGFDIHQPVGPNYLGGAMDNESRVAVHMAHRLGALAVTAYLLGLILVLWRVARSWSVLIAGLLTLQVALGISNVVWNLPLAVAVAHNAGGALLLIGLVALNYYLLVAGRVKSEQPA